MADPKDPVFDPSMTDKYMQFRAKYGVGGTSDGSFKELKDRLGVDGNPVSDAASGAAESVGKERANHPLFNALFGSSGVRAALGPTGGLALDLVNQSTKPMPQLRQPTSFERLTPGPRDPISFERDAPSMPVEKLPDAPALGMRSSGLAGAGGFLSGVGTDQSVRNAELDQEADLGGMQDKRTEEGAARMNVEAKKGELWERQAIAQKKAADDIAKVSADVDKELGEEDIKVQKSYDEAAARGKDPGRYFRKRDLGFWSTMLVGSVAGGMLSALQNQNTNPFIDTVRNAVTEDLQGQEEAIQQGWRRVKGQETAYERMRMRGIDKITATTRMYDKTLESIQTDMAAKLQKEQLPEIRANLEAGLQAIQLQRDGLKVEHEEKWRSIKERRAAAAAAAAAAAINRPLILQKALDEHNKTNAEIAHLGAQSEKERAEAGKAAMEGGGAFVPTGEATSEGGVKYQTGYFASGKERAKGIQEQRQVGEEYAAELDAMLEKRQAYRKAVQDMLLTKDPREAVKIQKLRNELETMGSHITTTYGHDEHLGSLDKGLQEHSKTIHGDAKSLDPGVDARLRQQAETARSKLARMDESERGQQAIRFVDPATGRVVVKGRADFNSPTTGKPEDLPGARPLK